MLSFVWNETVELWGRFVKCLMIETQFYFFTEQIQSETRKDITQENIQPGSKWCLPRQQGGKEGGSLREKGWEMGEERTRSGITKVQIQTPLPHPGTFYDYHMLGFVQVLENLESSGILLWYFFAEWIWPEITVTAGTIKRIQMSISLCKSWGGHRIPRLPNQEPD